MPGLRLFDVLWPRWIVKTVLCAIVELWAELLGVLPRLAGCRVDWYTPVCFAAAVGEQPKEYATSLLILQRQPTGGVGKPALVVDRNAVVQLDRDAEVARDRRCGALAQCSIRTVTEGIHAPLLPVNDSNQVVCVGFGAPAELWRRCACTESHAAQAVWIAREDLAVAALDAGATRSDEAASVCATPPRDGACCGIR